MRIETERTAQAEAQAQAHIAYMTTTAEGNFQQVHQQIDDLMQVIRDKESQLAQANEYIANLKTIQMPAATPPPCLDRVSKVENP